MRVLLPDSDNDMLIHKMHRDYPVIWYQSCSCQEIKLFCGYDLDRTASCYSCANNTSGLGRITEIKCPLIDITKVHLDLVLVPSRGGFLEDFTSLGGLHIGVVNQEILYEYDHDGLKITELGQEIDCKWRHCLPLNVKKKFDLSCCRGGRFDIAMHADCAIDDLLSNLHSNWLVADYHEETNNCFDFALKFVSLLTKSIIVSDGLNGGAQELADMTRDKISFSEYVIVPETKNLCRYLALHKKLGHSS